jgi:hypothetical protein
VISSSKLAFGDNKKNNLFNKLKFLNIKLVELTPLTNLKDKVDKAGGSLIKTISERNPF